MLQKFDEAIKVLNHTISLNPKNEDAYFMLASSYLGKGDTNNGLLCYTKIIELNPRNAQAYFLMSGIFKAQGDTIKAKEFMDKAISLGYKPN